MLVISVETACLGGKISRTGGRENGDGDEKNLSSEFDMIAMLLLLFHFSLQH